jgi:hypothetical protein
MKQCGCVHLNYQREAIDPQLACIDLFVELFVADNSFDFHATLISIRCVQASNTPRSIIHGQRSRFEIVRVALPINFQFSNPIVQPLRGER